MADTGNSFIHAQFFTFSFQLSPLFTAPLQLSGSPTPITTSSTVLLQAQRWVSHFGFSLSLSSPTSPLLSPLLLSPLPPPTPSTVSLQVEVCLITTLPGQINGCVLLLTSESSRQQTEALPRFHYDRVPIMIILLGFHEDTSSGMESHLSSPV